MQTKSANSMLVHNYRAVLKKCFWANIADRQTLLKNLGSLVSKSALAGLIIAGMTGLAGNIEVNSQTGSVSISNCVRNVAQIEESEFTTLIEENDLSVTMSEDQFCATITHPLTNGGNTQSIASGDNLLFNNSNDFTQSGVVSGAGTLTMGGTGNLILSGANTYSGGTFINSGTLTMNSLNALGTGDITFGGGTLKLGVTPAADYLFVHRFRFATGTTVANIDLNGQTLQISGGNMEPSVTSYKFTNTSASITNPSVVNLFGPNNPIGSYKIDVGQNVKINHNTFANILKLSGVGLYEIVSGTNLNITISDFSEFKGTLRLTANRGGFTVLGPTGNSANSRFALNTLTTADGSAVQLTTDTYLNALTGSGMIRMDATNTGTNIRNLDLEMVGNNTWSGKYGNNDAKTGSFTISSDGNKTGNARHTLTLSNAAHSNSAGATLIIKNAIVNLSSAGQWNSNVIINENGSLIVNAANTAVDAFGTTVGYTIDLKGGTLDLSNKATSRNITYDSGSLLNMGAYTGIITINTGKTLDVGTTNSFGCVITGDGSLNVSGGTLTISGANTYTGVTTISAGKIIVTGNGTLGPGAIVNNAALEINKTVDTTISNSISGTGGLIKTGSSTLTINTANTYTGGTTISGGTIVMGHENAFGTSGNITFGNGILKLGVNSPKGTTGAEFAQRFRFASGTTAANIDLNGKTLQLSGDAESPRVSSYNFSNTSATASTVNINGPNNVGYTYTINFINSNITVVHNTNAVVKLIGAGIFESKSSIKSSAIVSDFSKFTGTINILSSRGGFTTFGPTGNSTSSRFALNISTTADDRAVQLTTNIYLNALSGTGMIRMDEGSAQNVRNLDLEMVGNNTWSGKYGNSDTRTGNFIISSNGNKVGNDRYTLTLSNAGHSTSAGATLLINNAIVNISGTGQWNSNVIINENGSLIINTANTAVDAFGTTVGHTIDLQGGTLNLNGKATSRNITYNSGSLLNMGAYTGILTINANKTFNVGATNSFGFEISGDGALAVSGGTLTLRGANTYTGGTTISGSKVILAGNGTLGTGAVVNNAAIEVNKTADTTISGIISGSGTLTNLGTGILTLSGANTYAGGTTISAGKVVLTGNGTLGTGTIVNNATIEVNKTGDSTISGVISGSGTLTNSGTGTLTLSDANTYTGDTTISAGKIVLTGNGTLGTGAIVNNAALEINKAGDSTISVIISGSGTLTNSGTGTLTISGKNTYSGDTTISAGKVILTGDGTFGPGAIVNNAALEINKTDDTTISGVISGSGTLINSGTGVLTISDANTYTGGTTISAGKIIVTGTGALGTGDIVNNAALEINKTDDTTISGIISGTGTLTNSGVGVLTISGANTYTGGTTINAGALVAGDANALGTGVVTIAGGTLDINSKVISNNITFNSGAISNASAYTGTLTLDGNLTLIGGIDAAGIVVVNTGAIFTSDTAVAKVSGAGTYNYNGATALTVDVDGADFAFTGTLNNTGSEAVKTLTLTTTAVETSKTLGFAFGSGWTNINKTGVGSLTLGDDLSSVAIDIQEGVLVLGSTAKITANNMKSAAGTTLELVAGITIGGAELSQVNGESLIDSIKSQDGFLGNIIFALDRWSLTGRNEGSIAKMTSGSTGGSTVITSSDEKLITQAMGLGTKTFAKLDIASGTTTVAAVTDLTTSEIAVSSGATFVQNATGQLTNGEAAQNTTISGAGTFQIGNSGAEFVLNGFTGTLATTVGYDFSGKTITDITSVNVIGNDGKATLSEAQFESLASITGTNVDVVVNGDDVGVTADLTKTAITGTLNATAAEQTLSITGAGLIGFAIGSNFSSVNLDGSLGAGQTLDMEKTSATNYNVARGIVTLTGVITTGQTVNAQAGATTITDNIAGSVAISAGATVNNGGVVTGTITGEGIFNYNGNSGLTASATGNFGGFTGTLNSTTSQTLKLTTEVADIKTLGFTVGSGWTSIDYAGAGSLEIAAGKTLGTTAVTISGGTLVAGNASALGTGAITLTSGILDLSKIANSKTTALINNTITLTQNSTLKLGTIAADGTYKIFGGTIVGWNSLDLAKVSIAGFTVGGRLSLSKSGTLGEIIVSGLNGIGLVWNGGNNTWSTGAANSNWDHDNSSSTNNVEFINGDSVTFNAATGVANTITIEGSVAPKTISVIGGGDITFGGTGSIADINATTKTTLTKTGIGTLTINTANTYTGGTTISGGTIVMGHENAFGTSGNITFGNGILKLGVNSPKGTTGAEFAQRFRLASGTTTASIDLNGKTLQLSGDAETPPVSSYNFSNTSATASTVNIYGPNNTGYIYKIHIDSNIKVNHNSNAVVHLSGTGIYEFTSTIKSNTILGDFSKFKGTVNVKSSRGGFTVLGPTGNSASSRFALNISTTLDETAVKLTTNTYLNTLSGSGMIRMDEGAGTNIRNLDLEMLGNNTWNGKYGNNDVRTGSFTVSSNGDKVAYTLTLSNAGHSTNAGATLIINDAIVNLTKAGQWNSNVTINEYGSLIIDAANTAADAFGSTVGHTITINGGTLNLNGKATNRNITFNGGTLLNMGAYTGILTVNANKTFDVGATNSFGFVITGDGALAVSGGTLTLRGANTYAGGTTISAGKVILTGSGTLGTGTVTNNAALEINKTESTAISGVISGTGTLKNLGSGILTLSGANTYSGITTISAGKIIVTGSGALGTGNIINNAALEISKIDGITISSIISGTGTLINSGTGTLTLSGANTYTGVTTISAGKIIVTGNGTLGTGNIINNAALEINKTVNSTISSIISGSGTLTNSGSGTLTLSGANTYTGGTTISSGKVIVTGNGTLGTGAIANNAALEINKTVNSTISSIISGSGTLTNSGAGILTLSGVNTYIGGTTINAGTLIAGNAKSLGTGVVVLNGGTLDINSQAVANNITFNSGTILNASAYAGTLTVASDLTLDGVASIGGLIINEGKSFTSDTAVTKVSGAGTYNYTNSAFTVDVDGTDFAFTGTLNNTGSESVKTLTLATTTDTIKTLDFKLGSGWTNIDKIGAGVLTLGGDLSFVAIDIKAGSLVLDSTAKITVDKIKSAADTTLELVAGIIIGGVKLSQGNGESLIDSIKSQDGFLGNILFVLENWSLDGRNEGGIAKMISGSTGGSTVITSSQIIGITNAMGLGTKTFAKLDITGGTVTVANIADLTTSEIVIAAGATFVQNATGQLINGEAAQNTTISGAGTFQIGNSGAEFVLNGFTGTLATTVDYNFSGKTITGVTSVNVGDGTTATLSEAQFESSDLTSITGTNVDVVVNGDDVGVTADLTKVTITGTLNATTDGQTLSITGEGAVGFTIGSNFSTVNLDGSGVGQTLDMAKTSATNYSVTGGIVTINGAIATGKTVNAQAGVTTINDNIAGTVAITAGATVNNGSAVTGTITGEGTYNYTGTTDFNANVETAGSFGGFAGTLNSITTQSLTLTGGETTIAPTFTIGTGWNKLTIVNKVTYDNAFDGEIAIAGELTSNQIYSNVSGEGTYNYTGASANVTLGTDLIAFTGTLNSITSQTLILTGGITTTAPIFTIGTGWNKLEFVNKITYDNAFDGEIAIAGELTSNQIYSNVSGAGIYNYNGAAFTADVGGTDFAFTGTLSNTSTETTRTLTLTTIAETNKTLGFAIGSGWTNIDKEGTGTLTLGGDLSAVLIDIKAGVLALDTTAVIAVDKIKSTAGTTLELVAGATIGDVVLSQANGESLIDSIKSQDGFLGNILFVLENWSLDGRNEGGIAKMISGSTGGSTVITSSKDITITNAMELGTKTLAKLDITGGTVTVANTADLTTSEIAIAKDATFIQTATGQLTNGEAAQNTTISGTGTFQIGNSGAEFVLNGFTGTLATTVDYNFSEKTITDVTSVNVGDDTTATFSEAQFESLASITGTNVDVVVNGDDVGVTADLTKVVITGTLNATTDGQTLSITGEGSVGFTIGGNFSSINLDGTGVGQTLDMAKTSATNYNVTGGVVTLNGAIATGKTVNAQAGETTITGDIAGTVAITAGATVNNGSAVAGTIIGEGTYNYTGTTDFNANVETTGSFGGFTGTLNSTTTQTLTLTGGATTTIAPTFTIGTGWNKLAIVNKVTYDNAFAGEIAIEGELTSNQIYSNVSGAGTYNYTGASANVTLGTDLVTFTGIYDNTGSEEVKTLTLTGGETTTITPTFTVGTGWNKLEVVNQVTYDKAFDGEIAIAGELTSNQIYSNVSGTGTYNYTGTSDNVTVVGTNFLFTGTLNNTDSVGAGVLNLQVEGYNTLKVGSGWKTVNKTGAGALTLGGDLSAFAINIENGVLALDSTAVIAKDKIKLAAGTTLELVAGVLIDGSPLTSDKDDVILSLRKQEGVTISFVLVSWKLGDYETEEKVANSIKGNTGVSTVIISSKDREITSGMGLGTKQFAKLDITGGTLTVANTADLTTSEISIAKDATFVQKAAGQLLINSAEAITQNTTISGAGTFQISNSAADFELNGFTGTIATTVDYNFSGKTITGAAVVNVIGDVKATLSEAQFESSDLTSITGTNVDVVVNSDDVDVTADLTKVKITGALNAKIAETLDVITARTLNATTEGQTLSITGEGAVGFTVGSSFSTINLDGSGIGQTLDMTKTSANIYNVTGGIVTITGDITADKTVNAQAGTTRINDKIDGVVAIEAGATVNNGSAVTGTITGDGTFNYTGTTDFIANVRATESFGNFTGILNNASGKEIGLILNAITADTVSFDYGGNWSSITKTGTGELSVGVLHDVFNINEGAISLVTDAVTTYAGTITIANGASFNVVSDLTLNGKITGAGSLSVANNKILRLAENSAIIDKEIVWANATGGIIRLFDGAQIGDFTVGEKAQDQVLSWIDEMAAKGYEVKYVMGQFSGILDSAFINGVWNKAKQESYLAATDILDNTVSIGTTGSMSSLIIDEYASFAKNTEIETLVIGAGADVTLNDKNNLISAIIKMDGGQFTVGASDLTGKTVSGTGNILTTGDFTVESNFNDFKGTVSGTTATSTLTIKEAIVDYAISNYDNVKVQGTTTFNNVVSTNKLEIDATANLNIGESFVYSGELNGASAGIINSNNSKFVGNAGSSYSGRLTGSATLVSSTAFKDATVSNATLTIQGSGNELGTVENTSFVLDLGAGGFVGAPILSISTDNNINKVLAITTNNILKGKIELLSSSTVGDYKITINNGKEISVGNTIQTNSGKYALDVIDGILTLTAYNSYTDPNNSEQVVEAYDSSSSQAGTVVQSVNSAQNLTNIITSHISTNMTNGGSITIDNAFISKNLTSQDKLMASSNSRMILIQEEDKKDQFNVWGQAIYSRAENGGSNNFGDSTENSYGGMVGFEMSSSGNYNHGFFVTGLSSEIKGDNGYKTEGEGAYLGYYAGMRISDNYFANVGGMFGFTQIDTERRGGFSNEKITAEYDSRILSIFGEIGRNFQINDNVYARASVGTQYSFVMNEDYTESAGGNDVDSLNISSWTVGLDARLGYKFKRGYIEGRLGVVAELLDTEIESDFTIIDNPGTLYTSQGGDLDAVKVVVGIESGYRLSDNWSVKGGVLGEFGDSNQRITGNITFMFTW